ncbi:collagen alpha-1(XII) chain-like [Thunnus maccoyii]|uniref:collagen alpha-1(XII) chain-like n=1 Tax=Thunnus maccoyii TaxID=8240 RepID=UPI001C4CFED8|nr:collagen alpha-1(XII) chain-like [Thunnus maccoyii]
MDHLLMVLVLLWSSGLQAEDKHQPTGSQCESTAKADIGLALVYRYENISRRDYRNMKSFLTKIVSYFDIGPDKVQIGLVQGSEYPKTEWQLNTHQTKQSLLEAINHLPQRRGDSSGDDLGYTLGRLFKPKAGIRADSQRIAVLITDEESSYGIDPGAYDLKNIGIEIYIIAVNKGQLRDITSDPEETHVFRVSNSSFLLDIVDNVTINLCNSANSLESVRLVGGASRCAGTLEVKLGEWRPVGDSYWTMKEAAVICRVLDCGSAVSTGIRNEPSDRSVWWINHNCVQSGSSLRDCVLSSRFSSSIIELTCSDSVRLVNGISPCSGRLEESEMSPQTDLYGGSIMTVFSLDLH